MIGRGEVWWANLPVPVGSGPGHRRPVVVMQADAFNRSRLQTVVAVVLTSNLRLAEAPGNVFLGLQDTGLPRDSAANVTQIITLDRDLLDDYVALLPELAVREIEVGVRLVLGI